MNLTPKKLKIIIIVLVSLIAFGILIFAIVNKPAEVIESSGNTIIDAYRADLPKLEQAVIKNPNDLSAIRAYAIALYATGDLENAKIQYLHEKDLNANDSVLYNNLGNIYRDSAEYQLAVEAYQKSIDLDKTQVNVYSNLANLYIDSLKQPELGYGVYLKGIENNAINKSALLLQLGNTYKDAGLKDKAIDAYNQILKIDSKNIAAKAALESLK